MLSRARDNVGWPTAVIIIVLALCPLVFRNVTVQSVLVVAMIYAVGAVGLDLLTGYSGQFSFGQFVYFAFGAYVMSALVLREHWPWALALVAAVAGPACWPRSWGQPWSGCASSAPRSARSSWARRRST